MKILLVDDSGFSRKSTSNLLQKLDKEIEIMEADSVTRALEIFNKTTPDLVITDLVMPDQKGDALIKTLRAQGQTLFIAVLSANIQQLVQDEMLRIGADFFLGKPVNLEKLQKLMDAYKTKTNS
ncbi:MAG: response regulator [SAR324 cluster bacterium]|nr:response regulator [SAR324 cluster bacterium]